MSEPGGPDKRSTKDVMIELWSELFEGETITPASDFFDVGGDSILTIQLVSLAWENGVPLEVPDVFEHSVLGELADHIDSQGASRDSAQAP